jgi:hypothetical protein
VGLKDLLRHLQHDGQALLDRGGDPGRHLRGGVPVVGAHGAAALLAAATGRLMAHHLIDDPGGDAGVLQPGREGVPKVVGAMQIHLAGLMLDGVHFADACCVVALAIGADGTKVPVGLWLGDTENKTVVTALLADLVARGLNTDGGLLVVLDGAKALATAVRKEVGDTAFIQRCSRTSAATPATTSRRTNKPGSIASSPRASRTRTASSA